MISDAAQEAARKAAAKRVAEIKEALRQLPITREGMEFDLVSRWAKTLAGRTGAGLEKGRATPPFRPGSTAKVRSDLAKLVDRAEFIAAKMEAGGKHETARQILSTKIEKKLSEDTIAALDRAISALGEVECAREQIDLGYVRFRLPDDLRAGRVSAAMMRMVARLARTALSLEPEGRPTGPQPNLHAKAVAEGAAGAFWKLTGERPMMSNSSPTQKRESFFLLVGTLFEILGVKDADPDHYATQTALSFHQRLSEKPMA